MVNSIKELKSKISKLNKQISKLEAQVSKESTKLATKGFKELFKKHKSLQSFSWNQYTPYFNDGEECVFSAYIDYISINGSDETESSYDVRQFLDTLHNPKKEINKLQKRIEEQKKQKYPYDYLEEQIKAIENGSIEETRNKLAILEDIQEILSTISDDTYKTLFGDHVTVTVTKDGWSRSEEHTSEL